MCAICSVVAEPHKDAPPHMCYHAAFGGSTSKVSKIGERWSSTALLEMGGVADPKKHAIPHMSYLDECGRSALKGAGINREPPKLGNAGAFSRWNRGVLRQWVYA